MPIVVADEEGVTNSFAIYQAINYAVNHGARVINVSLGARSISKLEQAAITRAHQMGAIVVIASGNSNDYLMEFGPSSSKHALAVGQIDYSGTRSTVSNWGPNLGLVGPGEQIFSLVSKDDKHVKPSLRKIGYMKLNGTSFSTPMVAATASLIWAKDPTLTNTQVVDIILGTATDMDDEGWDGMTGYGLLNAASALRADADQHMMVMFNNIRVNTNARKKPVSLDVYGTIRGNVKEYYVEVGKGKRAKKFKPVAGPLKGAIDFKLLSRIKIQEHLRGSRDWILRIRAIGMGW